jgi:hypothetical protein
MLGNIGGEPGLAIKISGTSRAVEPKSAVNLKGTVDVNSRTPKSRPKSPAAQKRSIRRKWAGAPNEVVFFDPPPRSSSLTDYDRKHLALYMRLLDAAAEGADWTEVARIVFGLDPERDGARARAVHDSHLARARWMAAHGFRDLLRSALH